jgi:hypothetical protein
MKAIKEDAFEEGYNEGFNKGFNEGYSKECTRIITAMLNKGISPDEISSSCDIPLDTVIAIKNSVK